MEEITVITGTSGTLGTAVLNELLKKGHTVVSITRKKICCSDEKYNEVNIDLSNLEEIEKNKNKILKPFENKKFYKINIIHIAGVYELQPLPLDYEQIKKWNQIFNVNCISFYYIISILFDKIKEINNGCVLTVSSNLIERVNADTGAYVASKSALQTITKQLAYQLGKYNTNCNSISPGVFLSKMSSNISKEKMEEIKGNTSLNNIADETKIANVIISMIGEKFSWVTGQNIIADGGNTIGF